MEPYDASAPGTRDTAAELLLRMQARDADQRLLSLLDEVDELVEEGRARDRQEGLEPGIAELLDSISGDEKAPLEFRSIHHRVSEGKLDWEQFWLAPEEEVGGHRLINVAMKAQGALLVETLRTFEDEEPPPPPQGGVLGR